MRGRDILMSLLVLLPLVALVAVSSRGCSFSPGGPSVDPGTAPRVDAEQELRTFARRAPFPVRVPELPAGWRANSVDRRPGPGGAASIRVGWLAPDGSYLRLVQSGSEEAALVVAETREPDRTDRPGPPPEALGPVQVVNTRWVRYLGSNGEQAWVHDAGAARWLITGTGSEAEFRRLAAATATGTVLPRAG